MAKVIDAILSINPNAKVVTRGSDIDTIEIDWLDGTVEISKTDIQAKLTELNNNEEQVKQDAETKKASAKEKLLALGLTEEEIKLTFGI